MQYSVKLGEPEKEKTHCLILGVYEDNQLTDAAMKFDLISRGYISQILEYQDFTGRLEQTLFLINVPNIEAERILLVGCGKKAEMNEFNFQKVLSAVFSYLKNT